MQATSTLEVERRERLGSRYSKRAIAQGKLPCVLYGQEREPAHLLLDRKAALRLFHSGERVFTIALGDVTQHVLLKDLQFDYLGNNVIHCDLMRVDLDQEIEANVPLHLIGDAKGADVAGAVMVQKMNEIPVLCAVSALPDHLELNVSELGANEQLTAGEVALPSGVKLNCEPDDIAVIITVQAEEPEETAEAAAIDAEASPEVISEKPAEEGEGGDDENKEG